LVGSLDADGDDDGISVATVEPAVGDSVSARSVGEELTDGLDEGL
jgi:hypothetical protein